MDLKPQDSDNFAHAIDDFRNTIEVLVCSRECGLFDEDQYERTVFDVFTGQITIYRWLRETYKLEIGSSSVEHTLQALLMKFDRRLSSIVDVVRGVLPNENITQEMARMYFEDGLLGSNFKMTLLQLAIT